MRTINKVIVHCTATPEDRHTTVEDVRRWHLDRGWSDIGYHFLIYLDGSLHAGRPVEKQGAHCKGYNKGSIGIAYVGGIDKVNFKPKDTRTEEQKDTLVYILEWLKIQHPDAVIHGHRDFANKACPSFNATEEYDNITNMWK